MGGPAPCPIDLYAKLGGPPGATSEYMQLDITLNPNSNATQGPTVNGWDITYSCPFAE